MTEEEAIQQLSFWKELWESKKAECDKYENREYAWEKKYMLNCNIEVCKIALEALKQPERKKGKWIESKDTIISGACSCCGWNAIIFETDVAGMPFCPNCGAQMEEE